MYTTAAISIAALSLIGPAHAGSSAVGAGLVGFGIGAILGSAVTPQAMYVAPPTPPVYYVPPAGLLPGGGLWTSTLVRLL
jgi:hypothetical protein